MPNPAGNLIVGSDGEMDERVARLKRRLGVADRPVESRVDPAIVDSEPRGKRKSAPRRLARGLPDAKHCKGCRAWFQPLKNAQRYCDRCRAAKAEKPERAPSTYRPGTPERRNGNAPAPSPKQRLAAVEPEPVVVDAPLADRLLARLERAGTRLFTSELARGLHVRKGVEQVEDALRGLVADGRVECVVSWKVKR